MSKSKAAVVAPAKDSCPPFPPPKTKVPSNALARLEAGNKRFLKSKELKRCNKKRRQDYIVGQDPWAIILTCADSRLSPELIFDVGLGELFVARVAGNVGNDCSIASIEYAVVPKSSGGLGVKLVVVLGHENCGAVKAALNQKALSYNLNILLGHLAPVADQYSSRWKKASKSKKPGIELTASRQNTRNVAAELKQQSTIMGGAKDLVIVPAVYHTSTGKVKFDQKKYWQ